MDVTTDTMSADDSLALVIISAVTRVFLSYVLFIVIIIGLIGNSFSIIIFSRQRKVDQVSSAYLGPLALFDLINSGCAIQYWLVSGSSEMTNGFLYRRHHAETKLGCQALLFSVNYFLYLSGWTIVLFSLERALVIHFPFKMTTILTDCRRRIVLVAMALAGFVVHLLCLMAEPFDLGGVKFCPPGVGYHPALIAAFWVLTLGLNTALPCSILVITNIWILVGVFKSSREVAKHDQNTQKTEQRCLRNLIAVCTCYFIFVSPWSVILGFGFTDWGKDSPIIAQLSQFALSWISLNYAVNPLLYVWGLQFYRAELKRILLCRKRDA